jgi:prolyl-tRNA editing enzyme YbaK/EbsC (Cys-tRNA(Pro) deacylase)
VSGALDRFTEAARAFGVQPQVRRFPEGTKTAVDAANAIGCDLGQIVKSLVFIADGQPVLALTSGSNRVDEDRLAAVAGAGSARRARPEEARRATGFAVGGTPPVGHVAGAEQRLTAFVDPDLLAFDVVWAAAGTSDTVFPLAPEDLVRLSSGTVAAFAHPV